jgi:hypothetical protein
MLFIFLTINVINTMLLHSIRLTRSNFRIYSQCSNLLSFGSVTTSLISSGTTCLTSNKTIYLTRNQQSNLNSQYSKLLFKNQPNIYTNTMPQILTTQFDFNRNYNYIDQRLYSTGKKNNSRKTISNNKPFDKYISFVMRGVIKVLQFTCTTAIYVGSALVLAWGLLILAKSGNPILLFVVIVAILF